jgi:hypothetical protein
MAASLPPLYALRRHFPHRPFDRNHVAFFGWASWEKLQNGGLFADEGEWSNHRSEANPCESTLSR